MIYDGRHIDKMYNEDVIDCIGYHMYMTPEDAKIGINIFFKGCLTLMEIFLRIDKTSEEIS